MVFDLVVGESGRRRRPGKAREERMTEEGSYLPVGYYYYFAATFG